MIRLQIRVNDGDAGERDRVIEGDSILVGRDPVSDLPFPDRPGCPVSWSHVLIARSGDDITAEDLGSTNGTSLNGKTLDALSPEKIRPGDVMRLGLQGPLLEILAASLLANPANQTSWYLAIDGVKGGPFSSAQVIAYLKAGLITPATLVRQKGIEAWQTVGEVGLLLRSPSNALVAAQEKPGEATETDELPAQWYVIADDGRQLGPLSVDQLEDLKRDGSLTPNSLICKEGMDAWWRAGEFRELFAEPCSIVAREEVVVERSLHVIERSDAIVPAAIRMSPVSTSDRPMDVSGYFVGLLPQRQEHWKWLLIALGCGLAILWMAPRLLTAAFREQRPAQADLHSPPTAPLDKAPHNLAPRATLQPTRNLGRDW